MKGKPKAVTGEARKTREIRIERCQPREVETREIRIPTTGKAVKTSIKLDRELWKRAHVRAMDEGVDLQDLIAKALAAYLGGAR